MKPIWRLCQIECCDISFGRLLHSNDRVFRGGLFFQIFVYDENSWIGTSDDSVGTDVSYLLKKQTFIYPCPAFCRFDRSCVNLWMGDLTEQETAIRPSFFIVDHMLVGLISPGITYSILAVWYFYSISLMICNIFCHLINQYIRSTAKYRWGTCCIHIVLF